MGGGMNDAVNQTVDDAVFWAVRNAVRGATALAVFDAVYWAVHSTVIGTVHRAVFHTVFGAVGKDSHHPGLQDFLCEPEASWTPE
jgi:hypothetical protein